MTEPSRLTFTLNPLAWLAASFALGIAVAEYLFSEKFAIVLLVFAALPALLFAGRMAGTALLLVSFFGLGGFALQMQKTGIFPHRVRAIYEKGLIASGEPVEVEGVINGPAEPAFGGFFIKLDAKLLTYKGEEMRVSGIVRLFLPIDSEEMAADFRRLNLEPATRIAVACGLERASRFLNPGVISRREILDRQGIDAVASVKSPLLIEKIGQDAGFGPVASIYRIRQDLIDEFRVRLSTPAAGMVIATALGGRHFLDSETANLFREGGTFHILVISGLHITFLGGIAFLFIRLLTKKRWLQFIAVNSFLWTFTMVVGAEIPAMRASLMFTILTFGYLIYRPTSSLNGLGASAIILLAARPGDIFDPSFQLTFLSVAAIVTTAFPLIGKLREIGNWSPTAETPFPPRAPRALIRFCETLYWRERTWEINASRQVWSARLFKTPFFKNPGDFVIRRPLVFMFEGAVVSAIVQLWLLPLLIVYFHRVTPASVVLNLWVGPLMAIEAATALLGVSVAGISEALAAPLFAFTELVSRLLLFAPALFQSIDFASVRIPVYSGNIKVIYLIAPAAAAAASSIITGWQPFALSGRRKISLIGGISAGIMLVFLSGVILIHPQSTPDPTGQLRVDFLDVGQGDSALVTFPNGETMLIDGGGRPRFRNGDDEPRFEPDIPHIGEAVVSEFLWELGYSRIDYIVATHADADHMQGLADVARNFRIGAALFGRMPREDAEMAELYRELKKRSVAMHETASGESFQIGGAAVEVLNPSIQSGEGFSGNDDSVVLRISFGSRVFLFMGDVENKAERQLLASSKSLKADVVKVAHHGSRTSSIKEFVNTARPAYAVISVGRHSTFGHPHREVVDRWSAAGAEVMTTGEKGTITIMTDGQAIHVSRYLP